MNNQLDANFIAFLIQYPLCEKGLNFRPNKLITITTHMEVAGLWDQTTRYDTFNSIETYPLFPSSYFKRQKKKSRFPL